MTKIIEYLDPDLIFFLKASNRDEALKEMCELSASKGKIKDQTIFLEALIQREKIVSTGIGMGVAIPHAKLPQYDSFFISLGILNKSIDWSSLDTGWVRLIFMIGGPDDKQTEYLKILSSLTFIIKDEEKRKKILTLNDKHAIFELLT